MLHHFTDHIPGLPLLYPGVSRRLLMDLAERIQQALQTHTDRAALDNPHEYVRELMSEEDQRARAASPAFRRSVERAGVTENILVAKDPRVETPIADLVELLAEGIQGATGYEVHACLEHEDLTELKNASSNKINLLHTERGDHRLTHRAGEVTRIVWVTLAGLKIPQDELRAVLAPELIVVHNEVEEAHFCSIVPTIIVGQPDRRLVRLRTEALDAHHTHHRLHRDATILSAAPDNPCRLPVEPSRTEIVRWARNVINRQIGFTTSGGGASSYRTIAILDELNRSNMTVDVFGGLSGGAVIGAYLSGDEERGLERILERGPSISRILPLLMLSTKSMEAIVDQDLGYQRVGETSMRFFAVTTHLREGVPPQADIVTRATLGQAVRVSGSLPMGFAPTVIEGRRFADGMASAIVPTMVAINHGADVTMACDCVPGPNRTNPFGGHWLGKALYEYTPFDRAMDYWTWLFFLTENASTAYGQGSDVYFSFNPENIATLESLHWGQSYAILAKARREQDRIKQAVATFKQQYEALA